jgi:hypothetical protein
MSTYVTMCCLVVTLRENQRTYSDFGEGTKKGSCGETSDAWNTVVNVKSTCGIACGQPSGDVEASYLPQ